MNVERLETWVWRHLEVRVPADWELLQFSKTPAEGRCAFADRHGFRLELSWRTVAGPSASTTAKTPTTGPSS